MAAAYAGPIEALPIEEWAVRFRISPEHMKKIYTGKWTYLGSLPRIYAGHMHDWLEGEGAKILRPSSWDDVGDGDGEEARPGKHKPHAQA